MAKIFIILGAVFIFIGILLYFFKEIPVFRLPGDIVIKKGEYSFYFPITSSVVLSIVLSALLYLFSRFFQ